MDEESSFNKYIIATGPQRNYKDELDSQRTIEGKVKKTAYRVPFGTQSSLSVFRNYENALKTQNGKFLFKCFGGECQKNGHLRTSINNSGISLWSSVDYDQEYGYMAYEFAKDGIRYFIVIMSGTFPGEKTLSYEIHVIEIQEMEQSVSVKDMERSIDNDGKMAFHNIRFQTGSAILDSDYNESIEIIADYLRRNPSKKLFIVGHTDNTGSLAGNMDLSKRRAAAVVKVLMAKHGISSDRISPKGVGPLAPMATNTTDKGRALNRRVEVVLR